VTTPKTAKRIEIRPEHITLDEHGKVVINHAELAENVKAMLSTAVSRGPQSPQAAMFDWNCKCDDSDTGCA
jgi:hypothetical protein